MKQVFKERGFFRILTMLLLLVTGMGLRAQDVTISSSTGNLMAALTQEGESGSAAGNSSTWKHNQLALTLTVADFCNITEGGEIANPAGNLNTNSSGELTICGGNNPDVYMAVSLPKGFRFTGYEMVIANNINGRSANGRTRSAQQKIFYETSDLSHYAATTNMDYNNDNDYSYFTTINTAIGNNDPVYLAVARSKSSNSYVMKGSNEDNEADYYVITRTAMAADGSDMGNHLYFRLSHASNAGVGITLKSARFYFTAEGSFTEQVSPETKPSSITTTGVNFMNAPFTTGKLDLGDVSLDENGHYTYKYYNVRDLTANNVIYQEDAVPEGGDALPETPGTGGIFGTYNNGNYYYGLKANTYYVECPTTAPSDNGADSPVGFRIIGAKVNYTYGKDATGGSETQYKYYDQFTISAVYGGTRYYLGNGYGRSTDATSWFMDEEGYVRCGTNGENYLTIDSRWISQGFSGYTAYYMTTTTNKSSALKFKRDGGYLQVAEGDYNNYYVSYGAQYNNTYYWRPRANTNNNPVTVTNTGTQFAMPDGTISVPAFTAKPYKLTVYKHDGEAIEKEVTVTSETAPNFVELTNLNNDAIKFKIEGVDGNDPLALITVELTLQALDPYIDQMSVVCTDPESKIESTDESGNPVTKDLRITQTFNASDFSVSGGSFHFDLPDQCKDHTVQITFEDLYSHYADESYTKEKDGFVGSADHFSRYNFVKSAHYDAFGTTSNNIYTNMSEAASPQLERLKVGYVGDQAFKFNNAADVSAGSAQYYEEYPFSLDAYGASHFIEMKFKVSTENQEKVGYVFTTDETAYNIAPTHATQHRAYAYYTMNVSVKSATYSPKVEFVPVYSATLNGNEEETKYYGAKVTATTSDGEAGYASTDVIFQVIDGAVKATAASGSVKDADNNEIGTYSGKAGDLKDAKQLLYLDFSELAGIFQVTTVEHGSMDDYSNSNAANCLIFLPVGASAPNDNVAAKTPEGSFRAAHDIVLTDKEPFFSPYDISIAESQKAYYKRLITLQKYGQAQSASIIMPFQVTVDSEGKHTNTDGSYFTLHKMQADNSLEVKDEKLTAYFPQIEVARVTEPNKPYLVNIPEDQIPSDKTYSFIVSQNGATIKATPTNTDKTGMVTLAGDEATGSVPSGEAKGGYTFTSMGTFAGLHVAKTENIFYFAKNQFFSSLDLNRANVSIYPFRAYYKTETNSSVTPASLQIFFGKNENDNIEDAINDLHEKEMDMSVRAGRGTLTITSATDNHISISSLSGVSHYNLSMEAGETKTVSVPAGIYVVNGAKILVK